GPTHQAVEQTATLRLIPKMSLWRPCDAVESAVAWVTAVERADGPSCLLFSRQGLPHQTRTTEQIENIRRGGYVLSDCEGTPEAILIATGSEVGLAMQAAAALSEAGRRVRVVSMPATNIFDAQDANYRNSVLPPQVRARVAVEAGVTNFWYKYVGLDGRVVGIDSFGESAPAEDVFRHFGFTTENVVKAVEETLSSTEPQPSARRTAEA
ncbi:MAG: transketolase, partial [Gammaproteobacteria bacterium]